MPGSWTFVIGVHTPEFAYEKNFVDVRKQSELLAVGYPVALDNDYGIWRAFGNRARPAFYVEFCDAGVRAYAFTFG